MDLGTGLTVLGSAIGSKELIIKLLGPTAEYLGEGIKDWTEKRLQNVSRIFSKAINKLENDIEKPGLIHPKVLHFVINEGSFCDDEISTEYLSGILASSRSESNRDDRGASYLKLISNLSSYQIRSHFICYTLVKNIYSDFKLPIHDTWILKRMMVYITLNEYIKSMEFDEKELKGGDWDIGIINHSLNGLHRINLLNLDMFGRIDYIKEKAKEHYGITMDGFEDGIFFSPTSYGVELYLWATGQGNLPFTSFLSSKVKGLCIDEVVIPKNYKRLKELIDSSAPNKANSADAKSRAAD